MTTPLDLLNAEPVWKWGYRITALEEQCTKYTQSATELGRGPSTSDPEIRHQEAATWANKFRYKCNMGQVPPQALALVTALPYWTLKVRDLSIQSKIESLANFLSKYRRIPKRGVVKEKSEYDNYIYLKYRLSIGKLPDWASQQLQVCSGHLEHVCRWQRREQTRQKLQIFMTKHKRVPRVETDILEERRLGSFCSHTRARYRSGKLSSQDTSFFESLPGWSWVIPNNRYIKQKETNQ